MRCECIALAGLQPARQGSDHCVLCAADRAYELRMDKLATHPIFGYRVSYRRLLELRVRRLAKVLDRDIEKYKGFVTR
jgi:CRISPR/Cas system-associated endonuclease Cas1